MGFDVCGDLIAVGTDDETVQVFDGGTGREVRTGGGGALGERRLGGLARCLQFVGGEEERRGLRLLLAAGNGIEEWAW